MFSLQESIVSPNYHQHPVDEVPGEKNIESLEHVHSHCTAVRVVSPFVVLN